MKTANEPGWEPFTSLLFQVEVRAWRPKRSDPIPGASRFPRIALWGFQGCRSGPTSSLSRERKRHPEGRVVPPNTLGKARLSLCEGNSLLASLLSLSSLSLCSMYAFSKPAASEPFPSATPSQSLKQSVSYSPTGFLQDLPPWAASGLREGPGTAGGSPGPLQPDHWTPSWLSHTFQLGPDQSLQEFLLFSVELRSIGVNKTCLLSLFIIKRKHNPTDCGPPEWIRSLSTMTVSTHFLSSKYMALEISCPIWQTGDWFPDFTQEDCNRGDGHCHAH